MAIGVIAGLAFSLASAVPAKLPGVALGSEPLLHMERAIAFLAAYLLVFVVLVRAWAGELPTEISGRGLKYATQELQENTREALEALTEEALAQRTAIAELSARLDALEGGG